MGLVSEPLSECEAEVDLVLIYSPSFSYGNHPLKMLFSLRPHDLHDKVGGLVLKQGSLQPRFHLAVINCKMGYSLTF